MTYDYQTGQPSTYGADDGSRADAAKDVARETAQTAREQASGVAHSAAESGQHLAHEAKEQAKDVGREASRQAQDLLRQGRDTLQTQASDQQAKLAGSLRSFSQELDTMAGGSDQPGLATDLARQLSGRVDSVASWLDQREPGALLDEVSDFARRRPGTFLAVAAGAGLLVGRLTRGLKDVHDDENGTSGELTTTGTGTTTGAVPTRTSAYGAAAAPTTSTYGTGATYGAGTSTATGAAYAAGAGTATDYGTDGDTAYAGTSAGNPLEGVAAPADETAVYPEGGDYTEPYGTGAQVQEGALSTGDQVQDTYGAGTENPPSGAGQYSTGSYGYGTEGAGGTEGTDDSGVFGGGTTEVPEHEQNRPWSPVHDEGEQR